MIHQDRKHKAIEIPGGNSLALRVNRRTKRRRDDSGHASTRDFTAKLVVRLSTTGSRLVISVNQAQFAAGSCLSIPRLAVHNVVPSHSTIFKMARQGKVQDILELVGSGQASVHDRDEDGWSLLHVRSGCYISLVSVAPSSAALLTYLFG